MDFAYFTRLIWDRKWLILAVTILAAAATYVLSKSGSERYRAMTLVNTNITESGRVSDGAEQSASLRPWEIEAQFNNRIELINSKSVMSLLSRKLMLHDLSSEGPHFRSLSELGEKFSADQILDARAYFDKQYLQDVSGQANDFGDSSNQGARPSTVDASIREMMAVLGYDRDGLRKDLKVYRYKGSDQLKIEFFSENPELSAYVTNTLAEEFVSYYSRDIVKRSDRAVEFFTRLAFEKKQELTQKREELKQYKLENQIISIEDQSVGRIAQIQELELRREEQRKLIPANQAAIRSIDEQLGDNKAELENIRASNRQIQLLQDEITTLTSRSVGAAAEGLDDSDIRAEIESKREEMNGLIQDVAAEDPTLSETTQTLLATRMNLEIEMQIAEAGVGSINRELGRLGSEVVGFVENDATIEAMTGEIDLIQSEYLEVAAKQRDATEKALSINPISIAEYAEIPLRPEPGQTLFLTAFAGALGFAFCLVVLLGLGYLDMTLKTPDRFNRMTQIPLLGYLNRLKFANLDLETFFNQRSTDAELETFKQLLRKIRYQLEQNNTKRILITSTKEGEGKTFLIISLAYSLSLNNKKILIIDTNFKNNSLTQMLAKNPQENLINNQKLIGDAQLEEEFYTSRPISRTSHAGIDIIGSKAGYNSPSEIFAGKNFHKLLDQLELNYDYIFMEGSSMNDYSDTQELLDYSDHIIAVFSAESEIKSNDKDSIAILKDLQEKLLGGVLNRVELKHTA
jgi:Mrp family chromosome partitioning ATPase/uncharacterized protein involved in exopolysaccharide biosynthesis